MAEASKGSSSGNDFTELRTFLTVAAFSTHRAPKNDTPVMRKNIPDHPYCVATQPITGPSNTVPMLPKPALLQIQNYKLTSQ